AISPRNAAASASMRVCSSIGLLLRFGKRGCLLRWYRACVTGIETFGPTVQVRVMNCCYHFDFVPLRPDRIMRCAQRFVADRLRSFATRSALVLKLQPICQQCAHDFDK